MKGPVPMLRILGSKSSELSRGANNCSSDGRIKAKKVVAAAFTPGVLLNISTDNPKKNPHKSKEYRELLASNFNSRYTYKNGVAYPKSCMLLRMSACMMTNRQNHPNRLVNVVSIVFLPDIYGCGLMDASKVRCSSRCLLEMSKTLSNAAKSVVKLIRNK